MICQRLLLFSFCALCLLSANESPAQKAQNPVIFADVPDMSMMRVGDTYYMSSTTMHMAPGVPVMTSKDLINWKITSYCYDILDEVDALNLVNGKSTYGRGTWASSIRYHKGLFYVSTFAQTTNKTIYTPPTILKRANGKRLRLLRLTTITACFLTMTAAFILSGEWAVYASSSSRPI